MEPIRFFLPGPTHVPESARQAMTRQQIGHRSPVFKDLYRRLQPGLKRVFRTEKEVFTATGSASVVMEAAVVSTVSGKVLNLVSGAFSERWSTICRANRLDADILSAEWGEAIDPNAVRDALERESYDAVTLVHNETSTGVMNPLREIARVVRESSDALLLVDTVSSMGGAPIETDEWDIDVVLAGTQKALAAPPGLVFFTLSDRAMKQAESVERRGFYTDVLRYAKKHEADGTITTPAISVMYAMEPRLEEILAEGMEARWTRHAALREQTAEWAAENGFSYASADGAHSMTVSCLRPPDGVDAPGLVAALADQGITVGSGYGAWKPMTFRIGHMGEVRSSDLEFLFESIGSVVAGVAG